MNILNIFKFLILMLIFLICMYIGKLASKKHVYRLKELEEIYNSLEIFKIKLKFTQNPITEIFTEIANICKIKSISNIYLEANKNMETMIASISFEKAVDNQKRN